MWILKTIVFVVVAAVLTAVLSEGIQRLLWKKSNPGVSGGAASGVAVAVAMSRRRRAREKTVV
jgi:hypothetical protein